MGIEAQRALYISGTYGVTLLPHLLKKPEDRQQHRTLEPNDCLCSAQSVLRLQRCSPAMRQWRREPPLYPSLTLVSGHLCTQTDTKTNWDKLASSGLELAWAYYMAMAEILPPTDLSYLNNQHPLVISFDPQSVAGEHDSPSFTACLFPQALHMQSTGWCGGCSRRCVILIRQG